MSDSIRRSTRKRTAPVSYAPTKPKTTETVSNVNLGVKNCPGCKRLKVELESAENIITGYQKLSKNFTKVVQSKDSVIHSLRKALRMLTNEVRNMEPDTKHWDPAAMGDSIDLAKGIMASMGSDSDDSDERDSSDSSGNESGEEPQANSKTSDKS